ncbi:thiamine phosphate synthase [Algiphilus sp.]|uniref:thiamine phosphate synthase n=1 Tax=Algiphilus sp. TaxID=1872431 RepID=UPI0025BA53D3|nr:thiamine phosphate synthase [Algiphilus sp.]MCK5770310.1 thiamine phosphate synthase [Algiphilus sp.]
MSANVPRGLYAVTSARACADETTLRAAVGAALDGGAAMIQYRDKHATAGQREARASMLAALCHDRGRRFIVNDDAALAGAVGADGVHLGRDDGAVSAARAVLGPGALIGVSCGPYLDRVRAAETEGADYAAVGRLFASATKPDAPAATLDDLRAARAATRLPLCAIGGITAERVPEVVAAGADLVAAIAGVFDAGDVRAATAAYTLAFDRA